MKIVGAMLTLLGVWCCSKSDIVRVEPEKAPFFNKGDIGFYENNHSSKTSLAGNGISVVWENGDEVKVWAADSKDSLHLKAQTFKVFAGSGLGRSYFTSALASAMEEGTYRYVACYPAPSSIDSTTISFRLPASQDGTLDGIDFMLTEPVEAGRLKPLEKVEDYSFLSFNFKHKFHILRFYIPADHEGADAGLSQFSYKMPVNVVGSYVCDIYSQKDDCYISDEGPSNKVDMNLAVPLRPSAGARQYAYSAIIPFQSKEGDRLRFVNEDTLNIKVSFNTLSLEGRNFEAGHMTSVAIRPNIYDKRDLTVRFTGNEMGAPVNRMVLSGPDGLVWEKSGSNVIEIEDGGSIAVGSEFTEPYSISQELYDKITDDAPQQISVRMISGKIGKRASLELNAKNKKEFHLGMEAYLTGLLDEDFSNMPSFNNHSNATNGWQGDAGSFSTTFLNGWSGGRVGGEEGKCIRIAARRESGAWVEAKYPARADSAPVFDVIEPVDIILSFDYGVDETGYVTSGTYRYVGQTFYVGYVNGTNVRASGNSEMTTFKSENIPASSQRTGSYDNTPLHMDVEMHLEPGDDCRMTWRNDTGSKSEFGGNSTTWLYIDNVKVSIKKQEETE